MTTDTFKDDWNDLKTAIAEGRIQSPKSEMWRNAIRDFEGAGADHALSPGRRDYNFMAREAEPFGARLEKAWLTATFLGSVFLKRLSGVLWDFNLNRARHGWLMGYPRFKRFLQARGLWQEYAAFCAERGLVADNFNAAKLFYVSRIPELREAGAAPAVLEIGGGTGTLAVLLSLRLKPRLYTIVDLPEMMLHSSRTVRHMLPDMPIHFAHRMPAGPLKLPERGFFFVPHVDAHRLPSAAFDLALNIDSFQEMSRDQVWGYLDLVGRVGKPGAILATLNRRKTVGAFDNNPLTYPYPPSEVLRWETDPYMLNGLRAERADSWLIRVERLRKA